MFIFTLFFSWALLVKSFHFKITSTPVAGVAGMALLVSSPSSASNVEKIRWWDFLARFQSLEEDGYIYFTKEDALAMEERDVKRMAEMEARTEKKMAEMEARTEKKMAEMVWLMIFMFTISSIISAASGYYGRTISG